MQCCFPLVGVGAQVTLLDEDILCLEEVARIRMHLSGIFAFLVVRTETNFQAAAGIAVDGVVGPVTWGKLLT